MILFLYRQTIRHLVLIIHYHYTVFPRFLKIPSDITVKTSTTARLECSAVGHPPPEIAWQKDGGYDFPAARERRMHVMPSDDVFFIGNVKSEDQGVYTCTAKNNAGVIRANATLAVLCELLASCFDVSILIRLILIIRMSRPGVGGCTGLVLLACAVPSRRLVCAHSAVLRRTALHAVHRV